MQQTRRPEPTEEQIKSARLFVRVLLLLLAVPFAMLSGYLLPRWLSHGRAERTVSLLRPVVRPWAALLRLVLPTASEATGEYRAIGRESAAILAELTSVSAPVAHNLMLSLIFAMSAIGAYGILYNLLSAYRRWRCIPARRRRARRSRRWPMP